LSNDPVVTARPPTIYASKRDSAQMCLSFPESEMGIKQRQRDATHPARCTKRSVPVMNGRCRWMSPTFHTQSTRNHKSALNSRPSPTCFETPSIKT